jgi:hypothetical protein
MSYLTLVDLSEWNGTTGGHPLINFPLLAQNVDGFIIKASGGDGKTTPLYRDADFTYNQAEARKTGLPITYYHFAGGGDPVAECDYFLDQVGQLQEGESIADDFEISHSNPGPWCGQFYNRGHDKTGVWAFQYSPRGLMQLIYQSVPIAGLWVADPDDSPDGNVLYNGQPVPYKYVMQQFTSNGSKPGVEGHVDLNAFFYTGDKDNGIKELLAYGHHTPTIEAPVTTPEPVSAPVQSPTATPEVTPPPTETAPTQPTETPAPVSTPVSTTPDPGTPLSPTAPSAGTVMDVTPPPAKQTTLPIVVTIPKNEVAKLENEGKFIIGHYNKFLVATAGLLVMFIAQQYGSNAVVQYVVMVLTALGVYQVPNTKL